jgi:hypothetical protein
MVPSLERFLLITTACYCLHLCVAPCEFQKKKKRVKEDLLSLVRGDIAMRTLQDERKFWVEGEKSKPIRSFPLDRK